LIILGETGRAGSGKRIVLFIIFPEMNFRVNSKSRLKVGLGSEP